MSNQWSPPPHRPPAERPRRMPWIELTAGFLAAIIVGIAGAAIYVTFVSNDAPERAAGQLATTAAPSTNPTAVRASQAAAPTSVPATPVPPTPAPPTPAPTPTRVPPTPTPVPPTPTPVPPTPTPDPVVRPAPGATVIGLDQNATSWRPGLLEYIFEGWRSLYCPPGTDPAARVWGGGQVAGVGSIFTDDSNICAAAMQRGYVTVEGGGNFSLKLVPGVGTFQGVTANGVMSSSFADWPAGYLIAGP